MLGVDGSRGERGEREVTELKAYWNSPGERCIGFGEMVCSRGVVWAYIRATASHWSLYSGEERGHGAR